MKYLTSAILLASFAGTAAFANSEPIVPLPWFNPAANSANTSTGSDATVTIVAPLTITNSADLRFGDIAPNLTQSGLVQIATDNNKICASSLTCFTTSPTGAAQFNVAGFAYAVYDISVPASVTLNGAGSAAGESMTASLIGSKASGSLISGSDSFTVGGNLTVGADQTVGDYSGIFTVTVSYQ